MPDKTLNESSSSAPPKKSFSQYLIDTEIFPLPLLGKSIQYFGPKEVIAFLLGVAAVYAYSFYKPLPLLKPPAAPSAQTAPTVQTAPTEAKMIDLHGSVSTLQNKPLTDFQVAVMSNTVFPVTTSDGTFAIQVPLQEKYSLVVWEPGNPRMKVYGNLDVEMVHNQYKVDLPAFPEPQQ
jgi:hypothetical protein